MSNQLPASYYRAVITLAIEDMLNEKAMEYNYKDYHAAMAYIGSPVEKYHNESVAFRDWVSYVWYHLETVERDVVLGQRTVPTLEELLSELPQLVI